MEENMNQKSQADIEKLLLSSDEMAERYQELGKDYEYPYVIKISKNGQHLYFLGSKHLFDPEDEGFETIRKYWKEFLAETETKDCVVLVEGGERPIEGSEEEAKRHGEPSFSTYLASKEGVEVVSPEPDWEEESNRIAEKFGKEKTMYYHFARRVTHWHKLAEKPGFESYLSDYLARYDNKLGWQDFDFSIQHMIDVHNNKHDHEFDKKNYRCFYKDSNPFDNEISRESSLIRNIYMTWEIKRYWDEGKNIFIVYGSGHALTLEPALEELLK